MKLTDKQKEELRDKFHDEFPGPGIVDWWLSQIEQLEPELSDMEEFAKQRAIAFFRWYFKDANEAEWIEACSSTTYSGAYDMFMRSQLRSKPHTNLDQLLNDFYAELTEQGKKFNVKPHEVFNWFVDRLKL